MAAVIDDAVLRAALDYASRGWRIVPLYGTHKNGNCECSNARDPGHEGSAGKHPRLSEWETKATTDEEMILSWWSRWPTSNLGVVMGEVSGLIDFDCDSEEADQTYLRLFDGKPPVVPTYQSRRGKHRLFKWRPDLPNPDKARFKIGSLDVLTGYGAKGQQSVFPPSHRGDLQYKWLISPDEAELGEITDDMVARLWNLFGENMPLAPRPKSDRLKLYNQDQIVQTTDGRNDTIYKEACHMWRLYSTVRGPKSFHDPGTQSQIYQQMWAWNRAKCVPPLDDSEVQTAVDSARQFIERETAAVREASGPNLAMHGLEWREGEWHPGTWELTVLLGEPPWYYLRVPAWDQLLGEDKQIRLTAAQYRDAGAVAQAIFESTKTIIVDDRPGAWQALWNGSKGSKKDEIEPTRGLKAKLLDRAKLEQVSAEWKRQTMLIEMLTEKLQKARKAEKPDHRGVPVQQPDGTIWVRWTKMWEEELTLRKVTTAELQILSRTIGITPKDSRLHPPSGSGRLRYTILNPDHVARIEKLAELPPDTATTALATA